MRRRWSSSSSDLRVIFSVAVTVRSATSLRSSSSARRVSCSMSRRADASICSRCCAASAFVSSLRFSAALRARATMSSACSRASRSRPRYSWSSSSASCLARCADSIDSSIATRRLSSASAIRGKASLFSRYSVMPKASSAQIISPSSGLTRKLPPPPCSAASRVVIGLEEECDQAEDERVEDDRLGEREAEPLDARDLLAHLRLAGDRLDHLAEDVADADARADRAEAGADAEGDRLEAVGRRLGRSDYECGFEVHGVPP